MDQNNTPKLPQMLNVLTILTFIGSAIAAISALYNYFTISASYAMMDNLSSGMEGLDGQDGKLAETLMAGSVEMIKKQYENRTMIMILAIVGAALCVYGALQMRKLKKQGYMVYVIGEVIPIISFAVFIGFGGLLGGIGMIFTVIISALFIILYTTQRKALVYL